MHIGVYIVRNAKKCARTSNATHNMHRKNVKAINQLTTIVHKCSSASMFDTYDGQCPVPHSTVLRNRNGNSSTGQEGTRLVSRAAIISVFFLAGLLHLVSNCLRLLSSSGLGVGRRVPTSVSVGRQWQVTELPQLFRMKVR